MAENKRKIFDPTNSFTFFGSWVNAIEKAEKVSIETAYRFFKAICYYSMYDETPDFEDNPLLSMSWEVIEKEIDHSVNRRKRNFDKDTINEDYQKIINAIVEHPNSSLREIADITGTSKDMVSRVKKKYSKEIQDRQSKANEECTDDSDCDVDGYTVNDIDSDTNSDTVNDSDTDSDTMRQDSATVDISPKAENHSVLENNNDVKECRVMTISNPKKEQSEEEYTHRGITRLLHSKGRNTDISDEDLAEMKQDLLAMLEDEFGFLEKYSDLVGRLSNYYKLNEQVWCLQQILIKERRERLFRIKRFRSHESSIQHESKYINQCGHDLKSSLPYLSEERNVERIIKKYLSNHHESKYLKTIGDKYGRLINGWNAELQEPHMVYSMTPFPTGSKHKTDNIPESYYMDDESLPY